ncbi:hypothetical protein AaE_015823 [Aphanomyces astaci]|uniref:HTH CENPB-type domain-containing protein n=1 Tax=Aphanomyces astaci TaxID=112090 RepID=A0A6A4YYT6_APHAT|nr:hypothetical protein AaE_015823 [Aphanomyces astaci]
MKLRMLLEDKHALYVKHLQQPSATYSELAVWAKDTFNLHSTPSKQTVGRAITHHQTQSQRADIKARSIDRKVSLPVVETRLVEWVLRCEELGVCLTGELIRKQATALCDDLDIPASRRLTFSKGWLYKFQQKHGFTSKIQHGEAASTSLAAVENGRRDIQAATSGFSSPNIYNMDETSFFYCLSPHRSITRNRVPGTKKSSKRITLALTTNADGSDVVDPLFIGTAVQPRCFNRRTGIELGFDYHASKKAWMNGRIFNDFLTAMNDKMVEQDRKVLLLVDNAPPHMLDERTVLTNVKIKMLPPNTTTHLQPQDAGIIASFKAKLKQRQLQNALDQISMVMEGRQSGLYEVPLVEAMSWAKEAWRSVSPATISNCWGRTGILDSELSVLSNRLDVANLA